MSPQNRRTTRIHELIAAWPQLKILLANAGGTIAVQGTEEGIDDGIPAADGLNLPFLSEDELETHRWELAPVVPATYYNTRHLYIPFADGITATIRAQWIVPPDFDPRADLITLRIYHFGVTTVTNKDVRLTVGWARTTVGDDVNAASYTTAVQVVTHTDAFELAVDEIAISSGVTALDMGDLLLLRIERDGAHGDDTSTAAWGFAGARIRYQSDKLGGS